MDEYSVASFICKNDRAFITTMGFDVETFTLILISDFAKQTPFLVSNIDLLMPGQAARCAMDMQLSVESWGMVPTSQFGRDCMHCQHRRSGI
ncbi:uncharacterized protein BJ212DRAFT_1337376, partial [Suillus subaureus]